MTKFAVLVIIVSVLVVALVYLIAPKYTLAAAAIMPGTPP